MEDKYSEFEKLQGKIAESEGGVVSRISDTEFPYFAVVAHNELRTFSDESSARNYVGELTIEGKSFTFEQHFSKNYSRKIF